MILRLPDLPSDAFEKEDASSDEAFYGPPRLVTHIDAAATQALTRFYRQTLPPGGSLLDLMSSWVSHLPADVAYAEVVGHGMNAQELRANPRLDRFWIQDFNQDPTLPVADAAFDAALCCVGVQYLQDPLAVFAEVRRTLRPGAPFILAFSNRCFPTKAVRLWLALSGPERAALIGRLLVRAGFESPTLAILSDGRAGDPLAAVVGRAPPASSYGGVAKAALQ